MPSPQPLGLIDPSGKRTAYRGHPVPEPDVLRELHRRMVIGRRFDRQAGALTRQGRLAVYPSSHGQEACQIGGVLALGPRDWLFPTYRDSVALLTRGIDPVEVLTLLRGSWHSGYDPYHHRTGPQCTPLATNALHAVGLADAARRRGDDVAVLVLMGDGATSEGDAHEAFNFAAVYGAPVVFLIQNNGWAISVPLEKQSKAPTLAHKAVGYGIPGHLVDGNDAAAVYAVAHAALDRARSGEGPALIEAVTYRIEAHTNADDPSRYRDDDEVAAWRRRDPIDRMEAYLRAHDLIDDAGLDAVRAEAERVAAGVRERMRGDDPVEPGELFAHVYAEPTPHLREQRAMLEQELAADALEVSA